jgi:hypothetical protein
MSNTLEKLTAEAYSSLGINYPLNANLHARYADYSLSELFGNIWSEAGIISDDSDLNDMHEAYVEIHNMNQYIKCRIEVQRYIDNALKVRSIQLEDGTYSEIA